jgi:hypothetical protein
MMVRRNEDEISSDSAEPPYVQLATILRRRIEAGEITAKVPSERDLHQEFGLGAGHHPQSCADTKRRRPRAYGARLGHLRDEEGMRGHQLDMCGEWRPGW